MECKFCGEWGEWLWREDRWWRICAECNNDFVWGADEVGDSVEIEMGLEVWARISARCR